MPAIDIALPEDLGPDYVYQQGHTYGHEPTFVYLNTGYPKLATASVRINAGDYPWNHTAQEPFCVAWTIPVIVAGDKLRELLHRLVPLFRAVAAGLHVDPDPNPPTCDPEHPNFDADLGRPVGTRMLSPAAERARQDIADQLAHAFATWPRVEVHDVALTPEQERDLEHRITPGTALSPALADLAETVRAATPPTTPGNYVVMPGLLDRIRAIQDRKRANELRRLEAISRTIRTATADRDRLVVQAAGWPDARGTTSQRALAERTGLSARGVGKIIARSAVEETLDAQPLPGPSDAELATLHLEETTPEQRYRWASCEHPGARVHLADDAVVDDEQGSEGLPVRTVSDVDLSHYGQIRANWAVGTCGTCGAPVATFTLRTVDGIWQTPWTLMRERGAPEW